MKPVRAVKRTLKGKEWQLGRTDHPQGDADESVMPRKGDEEYVGIDDVLCVSLTPNPSSIEGGERTLK